MCPECIASVAMVAAGLSSAGGIGAVVASSLGRKGGSPIRVSEVVPKNVAEPPSASFAEWIAAMLEAPPQLGANLDLMQGERR